MVEPEVRRRLVVVKAVHTFAWAVFAGCILAVPAALAAGRADMALVLDVVVLGEVVVLVGNGMRCPLTDVAARYTDERRANFDIYLPEWLARHNQAIFGALYVVDLLLTGVAWARGGVG